MADISAEIAAFKNAVYGEDVRDAMVSLANKLNTELGQGISDAQVYNKQLVRFYVSDGGHVYSYRPRVNPYTTVYLTWVARAKTQAETNLVILDGRNNTSVNVKVSDVVNATLETRHDASWIKLGASQILVYDVVNRNVRVINRTTTIDSNYVVLFETGYSNETSNTAPWLSNEINNETISAAMAYSSPIYAAQVVENDTITGTALRPVRSNDGALCDQIYITTPDYTYSVDLDDVLTLIQAPNGYSYYFLPKAKELAVDLATRQILLLDGGTGTAGGSYVTLLNFSNYTYATSLSGNYQPTGLLASFVKEVDIRKCRHYGRSNAQVFITPSYSGEGAFFKICRLTGGNYTDGSIAIGLPWTSDFKDITESMYSSVCTTKVINGVTWYGGNTDVIYFNPITWSFRRAQANTRIRSFGEIIWFMPTGTSYTLDFIHEMSVFFRRDIDSLIYCYVGNSGYVDAISGWSYNSTSNTYIRVCAYGGAWSQLVVGWQCNAAFNFNIDIRNTTPELSTQTINGKDYLVIPNSKIIWFDLVSKSIVLTDRGAVPSSYICVYSGSYGGFNSAGLMGTLIGEGAMQKIQDSGFTNAIASRTGSEKVDSTICDKYTAVVGTSKEHESFIFWTDVHSHKNGSTFGNNPDGFDLIKAYSRNLPVEFVLNGGDWLNGNRDILETPAYLGFLYGINNQSFKKQYLICGNHDTAYQYLDDGTQSRVGWDRDRVAELYNPDFGSLYYDFDTNHSHWYIFNSDIDWGASSLTDITRPQISWFANKLIENNHKHICIGIHMWILGWSTDPETSERYNFYRPALANEIVNIINAYNNRSSYTYNGVTYNYSNKTNTHIEFVIAGHTHFDYEEALSSGVPVIITTNFKPNAPHDFDLIHADYGTRRLYAFRVGSNGEDRTFNLDTGELIPVVDDSE